MHIQIFRCLMHIVVAIALLICSEYTSAALLTKQPAPKQIEIGIYISNLFDINFATGSYKVSFWLWSKSVDDSYQLQKSIEIIGSRDVKVDSTYDTRLQDGRFYKSVKYTATINQIWDVRLFPFDTQKLKVIIESSSSEASQLQFVPDTESSKFDTSIALPGWNFRKMDVQSSDFSYQSDFGITGNDASTYSRIVATITLDHAGRRVFSTAFLGFFVADILTGVTMGIESFDITRVSIPPIARLNLVVGSLFGAVGNKYVADNSLPPTPTFSLPDLIQINAFSATAVALLAVISTETLTRMAFSPAVVTTVARSGVALYIASQVGLAAYFFANSQ